MADIDLVIHLAGRAHVVKELDNDARADYLKINAVASAEIAKKAMKAGVKRFLFISSVKVLGDKIDYGTPFNNASVINPPDDASYSKACTEDLLRETVANSSMQLVIIRSPLIYGLGAKANFSSLLHLAKKNLPLPIASVGNKRSMVGIDNLVDLIEACICSPNASGETF